MNSINKANVATKVNATVKETKVESNLDDIKLDQRFITLNLV